MKTVATVLTLVVAVACGSARERARNLAHGQEASVRQNPLVALWSAGMPAFGVYVPNESPRTEAQQRSEAVYTREGGARLARNHLYDFVFLNLEGSYDGDAVRAIADGLRAPGATGHKALLVRIPPIARDGADVSRARVREILTLGADGVVFPHIRSAEEARMAVSFFEEAAVWSPVNPDGEIIAMLMIEDPDALAQAASIADVPGYSILACGIGSLTRALGGDRAAAEVGNQAVLAHAKRVGLADMITADSSSVEQRVREGFLALLMQGPLADDVIRVGRAAAGRTQE